MRLDAALVARGAFDSRAKAQAAIAAGLVRVNGAVVAKPGRTVSPGDRVAAEAPHPWASRGGLKLDAALSAFGVDATGRVCLDIGASTGGFTDVLLSRGAAKVFAVDVGSDQFREALRADPRVVCLERTDARTLTPALIPLAPSLIVADVSFIALEKALGAALGLAAPEAELVCLFKPQFQVGPDHVGKGGLVRDETAIARAEAALTAWLADAGWPVRGWIDSPVLGGAGAKERLFYAIRR